MGTMPVTAANQTSPAMLLERVVVEGDLSKLSPAERVEYYRRVCDSLGLNPLTRPFQYIVLNGKLTLYATRDCTDQLRRIHRITVTIVSRERMEDIYVVTARATAPDGRSDESIGAVSIAGLKGDALANSLMRGETKAKRRATLSLVGLGWLDETETETVPGARPVEVADTGEIADAPQPAVTERAEPAPQAPQPQQPVLKPVPEVARGLARVARLAERAGIERTKLRGVCRELFAKRPEDLTEAEIGQWIEALEAEIALRERGSGS